MMPQSERYPFVSINPSSGTVGFLPFLPLTLTHAQRSIQAQGLLDTAATVNVLPYDLGIRLGANWSQQTTVIRLTGTLANDEARGLLLSAVVGKFPPALLAFAWTKNNAVPMLLGQVNFFAEFDVCLFRSQLAFEIKPK